MKIGYFILYYVCKKVQVEELIQYLERILIAHLYPAIFQ